MYLEVYKTIMHFLLFQNMGMPDLMNNFTNFTYVTIYQITFFIIFTTICLNVVFGIIVDTFSELRDLKVIASFSNL